jgi:hypothetical protein
VDKFASRPQRYTAPTRDPYISCAVSGCPMAGTISESRLHDDPRDARWYCREHWNLRGEPDKAHALALEMRRHPLPPRVHWSDAECERRMAQ